MASAWRRPWVRTALEWAWVVAVPIAGLGGLFAWTPAALPVYLLTWRWHRAVDPGPAVGRGYAAGLAAWAAAWGAVLASAAAPPGRAGLAAELARAVVGGFGPVAASVALLVLVHTRRLPPSDA